VLLRLRWLLKACKDIHVNLLGIYKIPVDVTAVGGREMHSEFHKHIYSVCHLEELPKKWKGSIFVSVYKNCDEIDSSNY
jgi:hypothetical protein